MIGNEEVQRVSGGPLFALRRRWRKPITILNPAEVCEMRTRAFGCETLREAALGDAPREAEHAPVIGISSKTFRGVEICGAAVYRYV